MQASSLLCGRMPAVQRHRSRACLRWASIPAMCQCHQLNSSVIGQPCQCLQRQRHTADSNSRLDHQCCCQTRCTCIHIALRHIVRRQQEALATTHPGMEELHGLWLDRPMPPSLAAFGALRCLSLHGTSWKQVARSIFDRTPATGQRDTPTYCRVASRALTQYVSQ